jgi:MinD-like ATPase involved in chromosome partitioning or flagellar assembly
MGKIISIHSFRGGTGKSNLVANLAATLATNGSQVGIIDTDIQSPGLHVLFGLDLKQAKFTLNDYLMDHCEVQDAAIDLTTTMLPARAERIKANNGRIFMIPSSMKVDEITQILSEGYDITLLTSGYKKLINRLELDYLLIDTHPGINEETLLSIGISDCLIVILRPDQQDFQGSALTTRIAKQLNVPKIGLVVNKVLPDYDVHELRKQMEKAYEVSVVSVIPLDHEMIRLGSRDIFNLCFPEHKISKEFQHISNWLEN